MGMIVCPFCRSILIGADSVPDNTVDSIKLRDGEVVLYKRKASNRWQARFKLPDNTWHRITTKRTSIDEASRIATEAYDQARFMHKAGINVVSRRFRDVAELAIKQMDTETDNGVGKVIYKDYKQAMNTYLIPYFGNKQVDAVTQDDVTRFDAWRTQEMKRKPAASTIMNHNAALHRVFDTAIAHGWMLQKSIPILKNKGKKSNRRPDFTMQDWKRVTANLPHWIKKADNDRTRHMRELLKVQLKSRLTIDEKYRDKGLYIAFYIERTDRWYIIEHDQLVELARSHTDWLESATWINEGKYHSSSPNEALRNVLSDYAL